MIFLLFLKFSWSCDFQYELSTHDPFYLEQFLQSGQTICINTTIENYIIILNSLENSTFKVFDQFNIERELGYDEMYKSAAAVSFGKMTGSLVVTNLQKNNKSSISFISLAAISFPKDECEVKAISNLQTNLIYFTFEDSSFCYFNGNGINFRYQFFVSNGVVEIRPPQNISNSVFVKHNSNYKSLDTKHIVKNSIFKKYNSHKNQINNIHPSVYSNGTYESIFFNDNLTYEVEKLDNPASFIRIDHYAPLIIFKPLKNATITSDKTFFMELGANNFPNRLESQFVSDIPGILMSKKEYTNEISQSVFYGCDPYIHTYDEEGKKLVIDKNGRTVSNYYLEILAKTVLSALFFYIILLSVLIYFLSFCCICPCCCCYRFCIKISCFKNKGVNHQLLEATNSSIQFMQVGSGSYSVSAETIDSMNETGFHDDTNISEYNNVNDFNDNTENTENINAYIVNENHEQPVETVEEEEADDSTNNAEEEYELHNIDDHHIRDATPQL